MAVGGDDVSATGLDQRPAGILHATAVAAQQAGRVHLGQPAAPAQLGDLVEVAVDQVAALGVAHDRHQAGGRDVLAACHEGVQVAWAGVRQRQLQEAGVESLHRQHARVDLEQPRLRADLPPHPEIHATLEPRPDLLAARRHAPAPLVGERMAVHRVRRRVLHGGAARPRLEHQLHRLVHRSHTVIPRRDHVAVDVDEATHHPQDRREAGGAVPVAHPGRQPAFSATGSAGLSGVDCRPS